MKELRKAIPVIVSALIWAGVMMACSAILKESGYYKGISNILICGAFAHIMLLSGSAVSNMNKDKCSR
ncbi:hypothetical protein [uncultured Arcticibacterium sp.]|uniref:hypothetical protein n=1 Tax=uncultured Arcticibacterium sp. TaxID=2173042 RepID=UPI0030F99388